ncbi:MAG TPA: exosortase A [Rhizomicrobium sp.]|nr:exosortase A [Rhizomicrobium sp.]
MQMTTASAPLTAKAWIRHTLALAALLCLTLIAFRSSVSAALTVWWVSPTYSHCFLIIPIVLWLIWEKRPALESVSPTLTPQALIVVPVLTLIWWMGELAAINEVQQYAVVMIMQAMIIALLGLPVVRTIWFPVFYLLALVPTGEYLIVPMQNFAAHFTDIGLSLLGVTFYRQGTLFELTSGRYEIAEACAGLRFLIATVTLGVLFAYMMFRKIYKIALFLLACVAVPLIGNGLRCIGIIMIAYLSGNEYGAGADHIVYGWGFNVAILVVLGAVGYLFRDEFSDKTVVLPSSPASPKKLASVTALAALLLGTGPALSWWHNNYFTPPDMTAIARPFQPGSWSLGAASASWRPEFSGADTQAAASISDGGGLPVDLYLGYYARPRPGHSMTAHINRFWEGEAWTLADSGNVTEQFAGNPVPFQEWIVTTHTEKRLIWSTYWVNGRFTTSMLKIRLLGAAAALQGHEGQAVIVLSTIMDTGPEEARKRLSAALPELNQLPARLEATNRQTAAGEMR